MGEKRARIRGRLFHFSGTDRAYIAHLESLVQYCLKCHSTALSPQSSQLKPQFQQQLQLQPQFQQQLQLQPQPQPQPQHQEQLQSQEQAPTQIQPSQLHTHPLPDNASRLNVSSINKNGQAGIGARQKELDSFLEKIPPGEKWTQISGNQLTWSLNAIASSTGFIHEGAPNLTKLNPFQRFEVYSNRSLSFAENQKVSHRVRNIQQLVISSWAILLQKSGKCTALQVDQTLSTLFGTRTSESGSKLRSATQFVHDVCSSLLLSQWGTNCFEIFFTYGKPLSSYLPFGNARKAAVTYTTWYLQGEKYANPYRNRGMSFAFPCILKLLVGSDYRSLEQICDHLNYSEEAKQILLQTWETEFAIPNDRFQRGEQPYSDNDLRLASKDGANDVLSTPSSMRTAEEDSCSYVPLDKDTIKQIITLQNEGLKEVLFTDFTPGPFATLKIERNLYDAFTVLVRSKKVTPRTVPLDHRSALRNRPAPCYELTLLSLASLLDLDGFGDIWLTTSPLVMYPFITFNIDCESLREMFIVVGKQYNTFPDHLDKALSDELQAHLTTLKSLIQSHNFEHIFTIHRLHRHFDLLQGDVVYGTKHTHPIYAWLAKPTPTDIISLDETHPHNICVSPAGHITSYEFRAGKFNGFPDGLDRFLEEFISYIRVHKLESVLGLQLIQEAVRNMTEIAFSTCTVMFEESNTTTQSIPTGWCATDGGVKNLSVYETHREVDGVHRRFNEGTPGNIEEAIDCLRNLGVLES